MMQPGIRISINRLTCSVWQTPPLAMIGNETAACISANAQNYPNRAVRVVVAAQTGGPDIVARVVAAELQAQMGQPFVVENQGGANGIVGATTVAKSAPDGYTLLVYSSGFVINPAVHKSLPYDTEKDFTPVTNLVSNGGLFFADTYAKTRSLAAVYFEHALYGCYLFTIGLGFYFYHGNAVR